MSTASSIHQNVVPSEVGWQFVPQYYTFVNKEPSRLHCFYTKTSTFIHGTEGEDVRPCYGQQEIHNKITAIGFEDCKVFIHSVDAQSSANGGIIIQVIGEMSNHGDPWKKFVQTFFLAEQPNGYFVLNDIFRFLKEDAVEDDVSESEPVPPMPQSEPAPGEQPAPEPVVEHETVSRDSTPPPAYVTEEEPTALQPEPPTPPSAPETTLTEPNGIHHDEPEPEPESASVVPSEPEPAPAVDPEPEPESAPSPAAQPQVPLPSASPVPPPPAPTQQPPAPARPVPKTWASLAAADSKRWGSQVATESKGLTEVPVASSSPAPTSGTQSPVTHGSGSRGGQQHGFREHPSVAAVMALTTPLCFVKGVVESVTQAQLTQTLTQRFGPVKEVEIVRSKACAFLEFTSLDHAKKAIITSLPQNQGGEGGVRIDVGAEAPVRILVETRKERGERPQPRPRGGGPMNGEGRGGFRGGRGGSGGRGRGAPPAK